MDEAWYDRMMPLFVREAEACLTTMERAIETLAADSSDSTARIELGRAAHTIKGNAAALGIRTMTQVAQRLEIWAMLPATTLTDAMVAGLEAGIADLRTMVREVSTDIPVGLA